jgi:ferredoxin
VVRIGIVIMTEKTKSVEISIDRDKCRYSMYDPLGCKKCLQVCGAAVFATRPNQKRDFSIPKEKRLEPTIWVLLTPWEDYCNGCGACIRACPYDAITIKIDGVSLLV